MAPLLLDADLPTNVCTVAQLALLPPECRSGDARRPLRHVDDRGAVSHYALNPWPTIALVLAVETMERFAYYGVYYTLTLYLTGVYDADWNAGFTSVEAASYVSLSTAVAYTTPFVGAYLADALLGDYCAILCGAGALYLPGLLLVAVTTVPHYRGARHFHHTALAVAVLGLWPLGTGIVKSVVNVFGARQFHPLLQSACIASYYVHFYTAINVGALLGITIVPVLAQKHHVTAAYLLPAALLATGVVLFVAGTPHYVIRPPPLPRSRQRRGGSGSGGDYQPTTPHKVVAPSARSATAAATTIPLGTIFRISLLIVPFCIAYSQMPTTFIVQGTVMQKACGGLLDAASMNSLDAVSVLVFGYLTAAHGYPALARRGVKIPTTHKFAAGSFLGALSLLWALYVEYRIRAAYADNSGRVSVLWQAPSYVLIGVGEIFAVSAAYEVAFVASAPQTKARASAINIFCVGGLPNLLCLVLYRACEPWFRNSRDGRPDIARVDDYVTAHVGRYFAVLAVILAGGVVLNLLPPVRAFVEAVERRAADLVKTPLVGRRPVAADGENTPLLRRKFPALVKMGSMRAGPTMNHTARDGANPAVKYSYIPLLYHSNNTAASNHTVVNPDAAVPHAPSSHMDRQGTM